MKETLKHRRDALKAEYANGQAQLADIEARAKNLRDTLMRISGAIQVIDEMLEEEERKTEVNEGAKT